MSMRTHYCGEVGETLAGRTLSVAGWVVYARVVRGQVLSVKQREYVQAAAALGTGRARVVLRHVLPNVAPSIVVVAMPNAGLS